MTLPQYTCCFTGHRVIDPAAMYRVKINLHKALRQAIQQGYRCFVAGGALGFDTMAAEAVLALREKHQTISLIVVAPYEGQADRWSENQIANYENIRNGADDYISLSAGYRRGCMQYRNRYMVDMSSLCVAYCLRESSGSAGTVSYAERKGVRVVNLAGEQEQMSLFFQEQPIYKPRWLR